MKLEIDGAWRTGLRHRKNHLRPLADDAVCCERLSAVDTLITRQNTGNLAIFEPIHARYCPKDLDVT
jgi:hypothetical protein